MANYHIKTPSVLNPSIGDVYWKGDNTWTETCADREVFAEKAPADTLAATTETRTLGNQTLTYQPKWWANSTVVTE